MEQPILNINGRKLPISITPPKSKDTKINEYLNDYTIKRARVTEYRPRSDCGNCMTHYHLAKRLNSKKEKVVLLIRRTGGDLIGDIIGIELI